jgi:hypothetical protein
MFSADRRRRDCDREREERAAICPTQTVAFKMLRILRDELERRMESDSTRCEHRGTRKQEMEVRVGLGKRWRRYTNVGKETNIHILDIW